jgi:hypothetical protein
VLPLFNILGSVPKMSKATSYGKGEPASCAVQHLANILSFKKLLDSLSSSPRDSKSLTGISAAHSR